jgi:multidrug resistance protein, MATE family
MVGQLGHVMVGVADSIMVGQLGTLPLAAVALGNSIFAIFMVFWPGGNLRAHPTCGQCRWYGEEKTSPQSSYITAGLLTLELLYSFFLILIGIIPLLPYLGQDKSLLPLATPYYIILSSSLIPLMLFMTFKQYAEGLSDTRTAMFVSIGCNLLNVALKLPAYFWEIGACPNSGLNGAGVATVIARWAMFAVMWWYVVNGPKKNSHVIFHPEFPVSQSSSSKATQYWYPIRITVYL